jgi:long-chain acyl-CoA synthetase
LSHSPRVLRTFGGSYMDTIGVALPMSHIAGFICLSQILDGTSTMVIFDQISPQSIMESVERYKVTGFWSVPPIFQLILQYPHRKVYHTTSLKFVAMMGMTVPLALMEDFQKEFPHVKVLTGFGLTEASPYITLCNPEDPLSKLGSLGRPVPGAEVKIVDDNEMDVAQGSIGEIITRGAHLMKGYYNQPEETAKRIRNGWLYTGDVGYFDQDGYLWHLGRKDDLVIIGGLNVYPAEVENVLKQMSQVSEAAVYGISDGIRGKILKASVVLGPGERISPRELLEFCRRNLANFKVPKQIEILDRLPKGHVGKVEKRLLARE